MHSDQFKPKSYVKLIKKYIFSEGEQFPLTGFPLSKNWYLAPTTAHMYPAHRWAIQQYAHRWAIQQYDTRPAEVQCLRCHDKFKVNVILGHQIPFDRLNIGLDNIGHWTLDKICATMCDKCLMGLFDHTMQCRR